MNAAYWTGLAFGFVMGAVVVAVPVSCALRLRASWHAENAAENLMRARMLELAAENLARIAKGEGGAK